MSVIVSAMPEVHALSRHVTQDIQGKLRAEVPAYTLDASDFGHALIIFGSRFELPMGIQWIRSRDTLERVNLSWRNASVEQMLDTLVKSQAGYQFYVNNGVVRVFPLELKSSTQNFLNLTVGKFEIHDQVVEVASHRLRDLVRPQVASPSGEAQRGKGFAYSQATNVGDPQFSLTFANVSVSQVLDGLIAASDRKIWVVTFASEKAMSATGYRRTVTLWNNANVPDSEQPVWDMFRWNDSIPPQ
jgi:hypothetical protein